MAIDIHIVDEPAVSSPGLTPPKKIQAKLSLNARKSIDGNIMIFDHQDMDIIVMAQTGKVLALPKELMSDAVYQAQDRMFSDLVKKGLLDPSSVRSGNVYGSMQGQLLQPSDPAVNGVETAVFAIGKFVEEEKPYFTTYDEYKDGDVDRLVEPTDEDTTELGEVPHSDKKGSLRPGYIRGPYGMTTFYRV